MPFTGPSRFAFTGSSASADDDNVMNILLTPARIGPVEIKNRIVMPPMTTRTADAEGFVTDDTVAYYMARVRGGVGLITVEMASPKKLAATAGMRSASTTTSSSLA